MGLYAVLRAIRSSSCLSWTQLCGFTYDTIPRMGSRNYGPQTSETEPALLPAFGVDDVRLQNSGSQPWVILPPRGYVATYRDIFFFTLFFFTILYWFCHTLTWIHHGCVHEFPILNPPPTSTPYHLSGSSLCTSPKHPVSCIKHRLAIHFLYDSIHVSMPFSLIIPPSPSVSKSPFYTSVSLLLSRIQGHPYHLYWYTLLVFFFLAYFTLYNRLQFHPPH